MHARKLGLISVSALLLSLMANVASAESINVSLGASFTDITYQGGAAVFGTADSWWNTYQYVSSTPNNVSVIGDDGNTLAGVTLTIKNSGGVGGITNSGASFVMQEGRYQNAGGIWTITLNGLQANTEYNFVGYASNGSTGGNWSVLTGTAGSGIYSNTGASYDLASGAGVAYSQFFVTSDASGKISISDTLSSGPVTFEGFQISSVSAVPEASTTGMMLAGLGMLGFMVRRRKQMV